MSRELGVAQAAGSARRVASYSDRPSLQAALADVDCVVHLAARVHVMQESAADPLGEFRRANVDSTRAIADVMQQRGGGRLVLVSSIKVHGEGGDGVVTERSPIAPQDPYGVSKAEAESVLFDEPRSNLHWAIVRPPLVYGPGVGGNFDRFISLANLSRRVPLPLGGVQNARSMVYVENLADLLLRCAVDGRAHGQALMVSDGVDFSTSELLRLLAHALGGPARLFHVPAALLRLGGAVTGRAAEIHRLLDSYQVDATHTRRLLGWQAPIEPNVAMARTVAAWRSK